MLTVEQYRMDGNQLNRMDVGMMKQWSILKINYEMNLNSIDHRGERNPPGLSKRSRNLSTFKQLLLAVLNSHCENEERQGRRISFSLNEFEDVPADERIRTFFTWICYILSNATRYARHPTRDLHIDVTVAITPEKIKVWIKDNGIGIDMNKHGNFYGKVREVYWKKGETQRSTLGRGIGFYLLVQNLRALSKDLKDDEIFSIDSILGEGTTVTLAMSLIFNKTQ
jgi:signal transduction histidine kinase